MAYATRIKTLCSKCGKSAGILTCRGCEKDFCYRHVAEHREDLNQQMDEITTNHDQLQQTIVEQQSQPECHPLLREIDVWEENSIEKIHQAAEEAREQLLIIVDQYRTKVAESLTHLTYELTKARHDNDYIETDLKEWIEKLEKLKIDLSAAQTIDFGLDNNDTALIPKIVINKILNDSFQTWFGDIQIVDNGTRILHGQSNQIAAVYTKDSYSSGQHTFRFKIEQLYTNQYFVFGIVTHETNANPNSSILFNLSKCGRSLIQSGSYHQNNLNLFSLHGSNNIIQTNDILVCQLDCDRQKLRIINERTNYQEEYNSNQIRCKQPWRMAIGLFHNNDSIRLC